MNEGSGLLWIALILAAGAIAALTAFFVTETRTYRKLARVLLLASFAVVTFTFLLMIYYFLTSNMAVAYVHANSRTDYPWYYKLAGAWAGDDGSLLLWTWFLSLFTVLFFFERKKDTPRRARFRSLTSAVLLAVLAALIFVLIVADPFKPTPPIYLVSEGLMNGLGMSPLLQTPLVIIHPPLEFAAYALVAVPFAAAVAHLALGKSQWTRMTMQWTRAAWLLLTLAIVLGALWAYTVLGWGGYWAWDPVETSNLLIWIPLTGLVHAGLWHRRKGYFPHVAPLFAGIVFALTFFATLETRTGIIVSIHSFTPFGGVAASNSLGLRLLSVLQAGGVVPLFFSAVAVSLLVIGALFMLYFAGVRRREGMAMGPIALVPYVYAAVLALLAVWVALDPSGAANTTLAVGNALSLGYGALGWVLLAGIFVGIPLLWVVATSPSEEVVGGGLKGLISDNGTMSIGLALFVLWTLVTLVLMILGANALNPQDFESRLPFLLVPVAAVLFAGLTWRFFTKTWIPYVLLFLVFAVLISYALFSSNLGAIYFPLVIALGFGTGLRIYRTWAPALLTRRLRIATALMLVSLLLSFLMWGAGLTNVGMFVAAIPSSFELSVLGLLGSIAAILLLAFAVSRADIRLWLVSGLLGVALVGFLVGAVLSAVAIALVVSARRDFDKRVRHRKIALTSILRGSSPQLVHLGVALVILGYGASAYFFSEQLVTARQGMSGSSPSGYEFSLVNSSGLDTDGDGLFESISAIVATSSHGSQLFTFTMKMTWRTEGVNYPHYLSDPLIRAGPEGDLYFTLLGFTTGNGTYSINDDPAGKADNATLSSAIFQFRENPLMAPLWGGAWLMGTGMVIRMWSEKGMYVRERPEEAVPTFRVESEPPKQVGASGGEEYYKKRLEEELQKEENSK